MFTLWARQVTRAGNSGGHGNKEKEPKILEISISFGIIDFFKKVFQLLLFFKVFPCI